MPTLTAAAACPYELTIVHTARRLGIGWEQIGAAAGMSAGQAREWYGEPED